jgi:hypothetical protein
MSIQSWKWSRNIESTIQFIIFFGNYRSRSSQNALQHERWSKIAGTGPGFRIRYGGTLHMVKSVVRAIPTSDGNARMPSGHSRRTTELGRVEWDRLPPLYFCQATQRRRRPTVPYTGRVAARNITGIRLSCQVQPSFSRNNSTVQDKIPTVPERRWYLPRNAKVLTVSLGRHDEWLCKHWLQVLCDG